MSIVSTNVPKGSTIEVQREFGTANFWRTVLVVQGRSAVSHSIPPLQMGKYEFRVIAIKGHTTEAALSHTKTVFSYGPVSLSNLCNAPNSSGGYRIGGSGCAPGTIQVAGKLFQYAFIGNYNALRPPNTGAIMSFSATTCDSISLQFSLGQGQQASAGDVAFAEVVQTKSDLQSASAPLGTVGTLNASLDGGPFNINNSATNGDEVYWAGSAMCWSATGER